MKGRAGGPSRAYDIGIIFFNVFEEDKGRESWRGGGDGGGTAPRSEVDVRTVWQWLLRPRRKPRHDVEDLTT